MGSNDRIVDNETKKQTTKLKTFQKHNLKKGDILSNKYKHNFQKRESKYKIFS